MQWDSGDLVKAIWSTHSFSVPWFWQVNVKWTKYTLRESLIIIINATVAIVVRWILDEKLESLRAGVICCNNCADSGVIRWVSVVQNVNEMHQKYSLPHKHWVVWLRYSYSYSDSDNCTGNSDIARKGSSMLIWIRVKDSVFFVVVVVVSVVIKPYFSNMKEKCRFSVCVLEIPKLQLSVALVLTLSNLHCKRSHIFCPWKALGINYVCDLSVISNLLSIISSPRGLNYTNILWKFEKKAHVFIFPVWYKLYIWTISGQNICF